MAFDENFFGKLGGLAPGNFLARGKVVFNARFVEPVKDLVEHRVLPEKGWDDDQVRFLLEVLSSMDTDKDPGAARVGEREARVASPLVSELAAGFCHGVGRSGDVVAPQPKAPGGTVMYALANSVARSFLKMFGLPTVKEAVVLPFGTGMSLFLCLSAIRAGLVERLTPGGVDRGSHGRLERLPSPISIPGFPHKVVVPRCDHGSPLKGIELAGFEPVVVQGVLKGDAVVVHPDAVEEALGPDTAAIVSTTTFFPPRRPDPVKEIAKLAKKHGVAHVINNAYGVQHPSFMKMVQAASSAGRVDYVVQSTDKNFLAPVGGAVVAAFERGKIPLLASQYAGRATAAPVVQFLAAALSLGRLGYEGLQALQQKNRRLLQERLGELAARNGERVIDVGNPIAVMMSLSNVRGDDLTRVGGALYTLRVTGPKVLVPDGVGWGSCIANYPVPYVVMNAAIGSREEHVVAAVDKLDRAIKQVTPRG
ncbi:MAG: O-phosphoseryl-tRNA(Sec) selenium transferase [Promethearchaeota archaeon]